MVNVYTTSFKKYIYMVFSLHAYSNDRKNFNSIIEVF